jgi:hypothetical protein
MSGDGKRQASEQEQVGEEGTTHRSIKTQSFNAPNIDSRSFFSAS